MNIQVSLLPQSHLFFLDDTFGLSHPLVVLIYIHQNLVLVVFPLTFVLDQQHENQRQAETGKKGSFFLQKVQTKESQPHNQKIGDKHSHMMSFDGFSPKIKLNILSYIIFLPHVDSITSHRQYQYPSYHNRYQSKHPQLNIHTSRTC